MVRVLGWETDQVSEGTQTMTWIVASDVAPYGSVALAVMNG
jgi:hypothetical protein